MLAVCEVTLFFHNGRQELAVGLTLTVTLVMYTMYQSISDSIAKTAYLKMIDYWLLFCLLVPFITFMLEIYWFIKQSFNKGTKINKNTKGNFRSKLVTKQCVQCLVPSLTIIFIVTYFTAAFTITLMA